MCAKTNVNGSGCEIPPGGAVKIPPRTICPVDAALETNSPYRGSVPRLKLTVCRGAGKSGDDCQMGKYGPGYDQRRTQEKVCFEPYDFPKMDSLISLLILTGGSEKITEPDSSNVTICS